MGLFRSSNKRRLLRDHRKVDALRGNEEHQKPTSTLMPSSRVLLFHRGLISCSRAEMAAIENYINITPFRFRDAIDQGAEGTIWSPMTLLLLLRVVILWKNRLNLVIHQESLCLAAATGKENQDGSPVLIRGSVWSSRNAWIILARLCCRLGSRASLWHLQHILS